MTTFQFIGVDIAKDKFDVALLRDNVKPLHKIFSGNASGYKKFLHWLHKHSIKQPWVCLEATGHYSELLAEFLYEHQVQVSVVNPFQIKQFAKLKLTRNKNDILDARIIAEYATQWKPRAFIPRPPQQKQLRELIQLLETLKKQRVQLQNQLTSVQDSVAKKIFKQQIKTLTRQIQSLETKIKCLAKADNDLSEKITALTEIKGIGELSALSILAYLPDISQFQNAKQLAAFIGVAPRQNQSGKFTGASYMSKLGNPRLRRAFYMPALSAKRHNEHLQPFVQRLEKNGLKPKAIVGAVMRKLVHIIFGMFKSHQPFNPALV